jgi:hypothetical protein
VAGGSRLAVAGGSRLTGLAGAAGSTLVLARVAGWRGNELRSAEGVFGRLSLRGLVRWHGVAEATDGSWEFREAGFGVRASSRADDTEVARLVRGAGDHGGAIELGSRLLEWEPTSRERRAWSLTEDGVEIAYYRRRWPAPVERIGVGLPSTAARVPDLALLVLFGCYLALTTPILQRQMRWVGDEDPIPVD